MKKIHTYSGLILLIVMVWMGLSGIVLNHRKVFSGVEMSRNYLPDEYKYDNWNYGFFKGSVKFSGDSVLLYGNEGIWLSDTRNSFVQEMNQGINSGADQRKVCRVIASPGRGCYCATLFALYRYDPEKGCWLSQPLPPGIDRITDLEWNGDDPVVLTRSELLIREEGRFVVKEIVSSPDRGNKRPLFRLIWTLHSGELFGVTGKVMVDLLALIILFLSFTGGVLWMGPKLIRFWKKRGRPTTGTVQTVRFSWKWHNRFGYWLILPLLVLIITGACLRPPVLILISGPEVTPPPFTTLAHSNPWHDQLRAIRYDAEQQEWLLYTSDGFYMMSALEHSPRKLRNQAPVSVMGINVWEQLDEEFWIVGSFNGFLLWNRYSGELFDGFTGQPYQKRGSIPFGQHKISGYSADFDDRIVLFLYDTGAYVFSQDHSFADMPGPYAVRPISLWNLALEMHTGRLLTFLGSWSILYPFVLGILSFLMLFSGWKVYRRRKYIRR